MFLLNSIGLSNINGAIEIIIVYICFWIAVFLIGLAVYLHRKNKDKKIIHDIQEKIKNENKDTNI